VLDRCQLWVTGLDPMWQAPRVKAGSGARLGTALASRSL